MLDHARRAVGPFVFSFSALSSAGFAQTTFQHVAVDLQGPEPMHVKAVGDLNGDGYADLVVAGTGGDVYWYEDRSAHPAWTRHVAVSAASGMGRWSTDGECADVDGDGDDDLVMSDWYDSHRIGWLENHGAGSSFSWHTIGQPRAHDIELADLDGDGDLDVVTREQKNDGRFVQLWRNGGGGSQWTRVTLSLPAVSSGEGLAIADLEGDGDPDLVIARYWYENTGDPFGGEWIEHEYGSSSDDPDAVVATGDIDGDGRLDAIVTASESAGGSGRTSWYRAPADPRSPGWARVTLEAGHETVVHSLAVGDLDLDGDLDVVTAEMHQGGNPDEVRAYYNDGTGAAWTKHVLATSGSHSALLVDVGGDGDLDVYGANWEGTDEVDLWENTLDAPSVGTPFCFDASSCPCGNGGGAGRGCANATGEGSALVALGTASVAADDLVLVASPVPSGEIGLLVMASGTGAPLPIGDGTSCMAIQTFRFAAQTTSGGALRQGPGIVATSHQRFPSHGHIVVGATWHFQAWHRDGAGPCGLGSNLSSGLSILFEP